MNKTVKRMSFIAMYIAIAVILDYLKTSFLPFLNMPFGGSINIALIPVVVASFHLGIADGLITGFLWWLITTLLGLNPWIVNAGQYLLDYIIPSCVVGLASIFYKKRTLLEIELGVLLVMVLRTLSVVVSGAYFWVEDTVVAGSWPAWVASFAYNGTYNIMSCVMLLIIIPIIVRSIRKYLI